MTTQLAEFACPVCRQSNRDEPRCACGWVLATEYEVGPVTDEDQREFDRKLAAAQREIDVRAAVLAAGQPRDEDLLHRILKFARGEPGSDDLGSTVDIEVDDETSVRAAVVNALSRLAAKGCGDLAIVEVTANGVSWARFGRDEVTFVLRGRLRSAAWRELVTVLPADSARQRFVLAGGIGTQPVSRDAVDQALAALVENFTSTVDDEILVLVRVPGWPVPARLVSLLREHNAGIRLTELVLSETPRAVTEAGVADILKHAPLCRDLAVVVADADPSGGPVRPCLHTIFPAGTSIALSSEVALQIMAPAVARTPMVVVPATGTGNDPQAWRALGLYQVSARPGEEHTLRFRLGDQAVVTVDCPDSAVEAAKRSEVAAQWSSIAAAIPDRYEPGAAGAADVVFAVELGGVPQDVQRRKDWVGAVIRSIEDDHLEPRLVRYRTIAYRDHSARRTVAAEVLEKCDFGPAADCLAFTAGLPANDVVYRETAPVEDALWAAGRKTPWRTGPVTKAVIIVGSRPPHLTVDRVTPKCRGGHNWRRLLDGMRTAQIKVTAAWDAPEWATHAHPDKREQDVRRTWRALGAVAPFDLSNTSPAGVVRRLALLDPVPVERPLVLPITRVAGGTP